MARHRARSAVFVSGAGPDTLPRKIQRIVVPLDAISERGAAIETAAQLALRWQARLHGVFVEDEDLLRLASLSFARQVSLAAGAEPLTPEMAAQQLRASAETARRDLAAVAARHHLRWSFEITRAMTSPEAIPAAEGDFIVVCGVSRPVGPHFRIPTGWNHEIEPASGSLLLTRAVSSSRAAVVVVLRDCAPASARVLEAAAELAEISGAPLTVVCAPDLTRSDGFDDWLREHAAARPVQLRIEAAMDDAAALHRRILELNCGLLAFAAGAAQNGLRELAVGAACDLLVMR
jgi:nucleotide-binding universal stress UspA family protein